MHHIFYSYKNEFQYETINKNRTCWFCQCNCNEFVAICNDCNKNKNKNKKIKININIKNKNDIYKNNN